MVVVGDSGEESHSLYCSFSLYLRSLSRDALGSYRKGVMRLRRPHPRLWPRWLKLPHGVGN